MAVKFADARKWYREHKDHVDRLCKSTEIAYAPTGSDALRPELWKAAHWRWFLGETTKPKQSWWTSFLEYFSWSPEDLDDLDIDFDHHHDDW